MQNQPNTRPPAVAGSFYPGTTAKLTDFLAQHLDPAEAADESVRAILVPHAGYAYSGPLAARAFSRVSPDCRRVILLGPSHQLGFHGIALAPFSDWETPLGKIAQDPAGTRLLEHPLFCQRADVHLGEHCLEVQIPFIQYHLPNARIIPLIVGNLTVEEQRQVAAELDKLHNDHTLLVISSDFTHYGPRFGYLPFPPTAAPEQLEPLDRGAIRPIEEQNPDAFRRYIKQSGATVCGRIPIGIFLELLSLSDEQVKTSLLDYTHSARLTGDYNHAVGYAALITVRETSGIQLRAEDRRLLLRVARETIAAKLENNAFTLPQNAAEHLFEPGATFVTLHLHGSLRGCIGSLKAHDPLIQNVCHNAINAAFHDPRFPPVQATELPQIKIEISYLTPMRPIAGAEDFLVGRHGILLEKGANRAVFLPQVAPEQGWDRATTLSFLARKAGLPPNAWQAPDARFSVFEAVVFQEADDTAP